MSQTLALLLDSYRELNAKRLFWIVLLLSVLVVLVFAAIGIKVDTITFLWFNTPIKSEMLEYLEPAKLYKIMFTTFGVNIWLTWVATILALVSTGGIFPDFMAGGSIDLYLSKPISRLRLFFTKYMGGMLFVTLQVGLFSLCCFLVLGLRGHSWEPRIFLSIPLVVVVFSYLFSICVLLGVTTRSTVASVLLTLLFWFALWGVQNAEGALLFFKLTQDEHAIQLDKRIEQTQKQLQQYSATRPATVPAGASLPWLRQAVPFGLFSGQDNRADLKSRLADLRTERSRIGTGLTTAHSILFDALTVLPKTEATGALLNRALADDKPDKDNLDQPPAFSDDRRMRGLNRPEREYVETELKKTYGRRSATWILSTSLTFEALIVGIAAWLFCRRDY